MAVPSITTNPLTRLVVLTLLGALITACGTEPTNTGNVESTPVDLDARFVFGATATANEPAIDLSDEVLQPVQEAVGKGTVGLTAYVGSASNQPLVNEDVSVYFDKATREISADPQVLEDGFSHNVTPIREKLRAAVGTQPELDLLGLLGVLASTPGQATLLVMSSGLQTTGLLDLRDAGSELDVASTLDRIPKDRLPDLTGKKVTFVGLGQVAGPQDRLTEKMKTNVQDLWLGVCAKAGGECDPVVRNSTGGDPRATVPVPTIPVPGESSVVVSGNVTTVTVPNGTLFFEESSDFLPGAPTVLSGVAHYFLPDHSSVPVEATAVGHTATWGERDGALGTSRDRARKVVDFLVGAGADRALFTHVDGVGFDQPLVPDTGPDGRLIPKAAERNRTVVLTVTRRSRS